MRVLVVEDERAVRSFLRRGIREAGYAVDAVGDGEDALSRAASRPYDAVVLDLMLPGLKLDLAARRVERAGQRVELTAREYALLEYMARNAGHVVTRPMIAEHVWETSFDTFSNVIDVYVRYLRKKIDEPFENKLIHTRRGLGYVLTPSP